MLILRFSLQALHLRITQTNG